MDKTVFVLLLGDDKGEPIDLFQDLMRKEARSKGAAAGFRVDVACAPGYDQYRVLRKRLADTSSPVDAVHTEPASVSTMRRTERTGTSRISASTSAVGGGCPCAKARAVATATSSAMASLCAGDRSPARISRRK